MDLSTLMGLLGVLATILFGVLSIYLVIRTRYPGEVTFVRELSIGLFDSIVKNLPDLSVAYRGHPVAHGLVLLKGSFLNTGRMDISSNLVREPISIALPPDYKWLAVKLVSHSPGIHGRLIIKDDRVMLEMDLMRREEYVRIEALAEIPTSVDSSDKIDPGKRLAESLRLSHRIADLRPMGQRTVHSGETYRSMSKYVKVLIAVCTSTCIVVAVQVTFEPFSRIDYLIPGPDGTQIAARAVPHKDSTIVLKGTHSTFEKTYTVSEFAATSGMQPIVVPDLREQAVALIPLVIALLLGLVIIALNTLAMRRARRLSRLLDLNE